MQLVELVNLNLNEFKLGVLVAQIVPILRTKDKYSTISRRCSAKNLAFMHNSYIYATIRIIFHTTTRAMRYVKFSLMLGMGAVGIAVFLHIKSQSEQRMVCLKL